MQVPRIDRPTLGQDTRHSEDAAYLAEAYGLTPYPWQRLVLDRWLVVNPEGRHTAARCGLAVPRQNGKNAVLEIVELFKLVAQGRRILHTAHQVKTARVAFLRLAGFFENPRQYPELARLCVAVRRTNGQEAIYLHNGASVEYVARSKSSGRGFTVDDIVLDEAQELSEDALAALLPTILAAPSGNPQVFLTGTPPGPNNDGAVWTRTRDTALAGQDPRLAWLEWSAAGSVDLDSPEVWAGSNPSLGVGKVLAEQLADDRHAMDDDTFGRECLGMWPSEVVHQVIPPEAWAACATTAPTTAGPHAFAVDMSPDRKRAAIGAARLDEATGLVHVEVAEADSTEYGAGWVATWLTSPDRRGVPVAVVIDALSPAASLVPALTAAGVPVSMTGTTDMVRACGSFYDRVMARTLTHYDQATLNRALVMARRRPIGAEGGWGWNRKAPGGDITPLVAVTLAAHGLVSRKPVKPRTGRAVFA